MKVGKPSDWWVQIRKVLRRDGDEQATRDARDATIPHPLTPFDYPSDSIRLSSPSIDTKPTST
eukprot:scaffold87191_cov33-Tisochrysis_lutea.AAC.2